MWTVSTFSALPVGCCTRAAQPFLVALSAQAQMQLLSYVLAAILGITRHHAAHVPLKLCMHMYKCHRPSLFSIRVLLKLPSLINHGKRRETLPSCLRTPRPLHDPLSRKHSPWVVSTNILAWEEKTQALFIPTYYVLDWLYTSPVCSADHTPYHYGRGTRWTLRSPLTLGVVWKMGLTISKHMILSFREAEKHRGFRGWARIRV